MQSWRLLSGTKADGFSTKGWKLIFRTAGIPAVLEEEFTLHCCLPWCLRASVVTASALCWTSFDAGFLLGLKT